MEKSQKAILRTLVIMFVICFVIKDIEFLYIKTDSTFIGENIICKIVCIIATAITSYKLGYKLSDIGFKNKKVIRYAICGLGLGIVTFAISYGSISLFFNPNTKCFVDLYLILIGFVFFIFIGSLTFISDYLLELQLILVSIFG